jgi:type II secretory pathway pseudopilin PulG
MKYVNSTCGKESLHAAARGGFTIIEVTLALGVLTVAMVLIAEVSVWSLREQSRSSARQTAEEVAANVLEEARACPWDELTPAWAAAQRLPEPLLQRDWRLTVRVEPEKSLPEVKRVSVAVQWAASEGAPAAPVQLVSLFSARSISSPGGKP